MRNGERHIYELFEVEKDNNPVCGKMILPPDSPFISQLFHKVNFLI